MLINPLTLLLPGPDFPVVIAGPCSAESEAQVMETAKALEHDNRVRAFRAGVWKPRTRPGSFEGAGNAALPWLQRVQEECDLRVIVEVATPAHVEACLEHDINYFWIGARTTVNPFSVQELAEALRGTGTPLLIKNPVNPDLQLWIGALERFYNAGLTNLAAVHRGFASFNKTPYRNEPLWQIPIEFKRLFPEIPMLCDPSHICGRTDLLAETAQTALNLQMDGIMIETHPNPAKALSDAKQQITPAALTLLLNGLTVRSAESENPDWLTAIELHRSHTDRIDQTILQALAERMEQVRAIGELKRDNGVTVLQLKRWNQVINHLMQEGNRLGLPQPMVKQLYDLIHQASLSLQEEIVNRNEG